MSSTAPVWNDLLLANKDDPDVTQTLAEFKAELKKVLRPEDVEGLPLRRSRGAHFRELRRSYKRPALHSRP